MAVKSRTAMQALENQRQRRLLRAPEACARVGFTSTSTLYSAMDRLGFPKPVKIGTRSVAWIEEEVAAWVEARIAQRDGTP
jgi:prophage regulatory protein